MTPIGVATRCDSTTQATLPDGPKVYLRCMYLRNHNGAHAFYVVWPEDDDAA